MVELSVKKFVKSLFASITLHCIVLKACDGAETCIVSCHSEQKVWDGSTDIHFSYEDGENRTSKLSEITGLSLTDLNIEENENPNCKTPR